MSIKDKRFFLGGNTPLGFYSFFHEIIPLEKANKIICLKGGPGTGKSSIMKKLGEYYKSINHEVEFYHCSSDSSSLDGILIKDLKVAILDGTAPHVVDPKVPGAVDEIINLGEFWNEFEIRKNKDQIINIKNSISKTFDRAYKYLSAAKIIHDDWSNMNSDALNYNKFNFLREDLKNKIFKQPISSLGTCKDLFITAFTPTGIVTFIEDLLEQCETTYVLNGPPGTSKDKILEYLKDEALKRGFNVEAFHNPIAPEELEHIYIPALKLAVISSNEINQTLYKGHQIYMENYLNYDLINCVNEKIINSKDLFYTLLNKSLSILTEAKKLHDDIEKYYIPNMDFQELDKVHEVIINKITASQ
ncbi:PRK06851 family protein [Hathewaya histolytica]|uniref:ATPase n=1 Tax=Hathewaya histolytica TaxID=1498 RepID=A0A4U9R496_HATHI|nr:PRK06851 family protein [Hathewaya histolytica]VTQ84833.1 ATPase [Hathewaya histolytica]